MKRTIPVLPLLAFVATTTWEPIASAQDANFVCNVPADAPESSLWDYSYWLYRALNPSEANPTGMVGVPPESVLAPSLPLGADERRLVLFGDLMPTDEEELPLVDPEIQGLFASADLVIGNVEGPVYRSRLNVQASQWGDFHSSTGYLNSFYAQFCVDPMRTVFTVANNHSADHGRWPETLRAVIPVTEGPGSTTGCAPDSLSPNACYPSQVRGVVGRHASTWDDVDVYDLGGVRVGVVGWTQVENCEPDPSWGDTVWRKQDKVWDDGSCNGLTRDWNAVKAARHIDVLLGYVQWDRQFFYFPQPETQELGRRLVAMGFDVIAGADPHVIQPAQILPDGMVFHSLGGLNVNFGLLSSTSLVAAFEVIVNSRGQVTRYKVHPFAQRAAASGTTLPGSTQCNFKGTGPAVRTDVSRVTHSELVPLRKVNNLLGVRSKLQRQLDLVFPPR